MLHTQRKRLGRNKMKRLLWVLLGLGLIGIVMIVAYFWVMAGIGLG